MTEYILQHEMVTLKATYVRNKKIAFLYGCNPALVPSIMRQLARHFETVTCSNDLNEALQWITDNTPDLVLIDDYFAKDAHIFVDQAKSNVTHTKIIAMVDYQGSREYHNQLDGVFEKPLCWAEVKKYFQQIGSAGSHETLSC